MKGLMYFWYSVKDLGGFTESEFKPILEEAQREASNLSPSVDKLIVKWVQILDRLDKEGVRDVDLVEYGSMAVEMCLQRNLYPDLAGELNLALSALQGLSNLSNNEAARRLVRNEA